MIPKVIHQLWIGPRPAPQKWLCTWREKNPDWQYEFWDNARCEAFAFQNAAKIAEMPEWNGKADIMRYEILAAHGGFFVDADAECLRPLDESLLQHDSFTCYEHEILRPGLLACGYLGACAGNELMALCVREIAGASLAGRRAWETVGPQLLTDTVRKHAYSRLHVYPSGLFIPRHYTGYAGMYAKEPPYARQFWGSTFNSYEG